MSSPITGLYAIIDPQFCGASSPLELAHALLSGGCRLLQIRVKGEPSARDVWERRTTVAREIIALKRTYDFCCIINDDVALARELHADGVHLGTDDMRLAQARELLGPSAMIGYSAHRLDEAVTAQVGGASYVAFGAIYPTPTKGPDHPIQGLARLTEVVRTLSVPVVAIGGITRENVLPIWETGVAAVAMITSLSHAPDPRAEAQWFVQRLRRP